jgi:hypothetical protein
MRIGQSVGASLRVQWICVAAALTLGVLQTVFLDIGMRI